MTKTKTKTLLVGHAADNPHELPADYALQKSAVLGSTGSGKSNAAVVLAEELAAAGVPWVAVDPKGDWHGIRSSADGAGPGLAVPVFGGEYGDVPLEYTSGKVMARLVAERRLSCVLDVSDFDTRQQMFRFLGDFASTLLHANREPLHVFAEECDDYLPQRAADKGELPKALGAWTRLIKRGRSHGIGSTLISQRPQAVSKDALNQAQTLLVFRLTGAHEIRAVQEWLCGPGVKPDDEEKALLDSLRRLEDGECWLWSPQWLKVRERLTFRRRWTFDSGATPSLEDVVITPTATAEIDLEALGEEIAASLERAKQDDPELLRQEVAQQTALATTWKGAADRLAVELEDARERPVVVAPDLTPLVEAARAAGVSLEVVYRDLYTGMTAALRESQERARQVAESVVVAATRVAAETTPCETNVEMLSHAWRPEPAISSPADVLTETAARASVELSHARPGGGSRVVADDDVKLDTAQRKVMTVLIQHGERNKAQLSLQTGYSAKASTVGVALSKLTRHGYVQAEGGGLYTATDLGRASVAVEALPSGHELLEHWRGRLGDSAERKVLDELVKHYPGEMTHDSLCELTGYSVTASTVGVALSKLRTYGLTVGTKALSKASPDFMAAITR